MENVVAALLWGLVELVLIFTGKFVVAIASFGRWRGERFSSNESRVYSPAGALSFKREGQRVITANGLLFIGLLSYVLLALVLLWVSSWA